MIGVPARLEKGGTESEFLVMPKTVKMGRSGGLSGVGRSSLREGLVLMPHSYNYSSSNIEAQTLDCANQIGGSMCNGYAQVSVGSVSRKVTI